MDGRNGVHRIVIVGRGADGFALAARLGRTLGRSGKVSVTLVDQSKSHLLKHFLFEGTAHFSNERDEDTAAEMQTEAHAFKLRLGRVDEVDRAKREVTLESIANEHGREIIRARRLGYDTLFLGSPEGLFEMLR